MCCKHVTTCTIQRYQRVRASDAAPRLDVVVHRLLVWDVCFVSDVPGRDGTIQEVVQATTKQQEQTLYNTQHLKQ